MTSMLEAPSEANVSQGLNALAIILGAKILNNVGFEVVDYLNNFYTVIFAWNDFKALFGNLWMPIYQSLLFPLEIVATYTRLNLADLLYVVLFALVGTTFDTSNVFCKWMFMYIPALISLYSALENVWSEVKYVIHYVKVLHHQETYLFLTIGGILAVVTTMAYTLGPLAIASKTIYPNLI